MTTRRDAIMWATKEYHLGVAFGLLPSPHDSSGAAEHAVPRRRSENLSGAQYAQAGNARQMMRPAGPIYK